MAILDNIRDIATKAVPQKKQSLPVPGSTGVGHGIYRGEDVRRSPQLRILYHMLIYHYSSFYGNPSLYVLWRMEDGVG
jgi:hypothetical protein